MLGPPIRCCVLCWALLCAPAFYAGPSHTLLGPRMLPMLPSPYAMLGPAMLSPRVAP